MDGFICVWKPKGMTSHDVVLRLRRILNTKKIGHSGTLDPDVPGVLVVGVNRATKCLNYLPEHTKEYLGTVVLGAATETEDASGAVIDLRSVQEIPKEQLDRVLQLRHGVQIQIPPMYSAVKVQGKKLYEYARAGASVTRPRREITIHQLKQTSPLIYDKDHNQASFNIYVACSKGTYIRTLAVDLGKDLGYPAHLGSLIRLSSDGFSAEESWTLDQIEDLQKMQATYQFLRPISSAFSHIPHVRLTEEMWNVLRQGTPFFKRFSPPKETPFLALYQDQAVALYEHCLGQEDAFLVKMINNQI